MHGEVDIEGEGEGRISTRKQRERRERGGIQLLPSNFSKLLTLTILYLEKMPKWLQVVINPKCVNTKFQLSATKIKSRTSF